MQTRRALLTGVFLFALAGLPQAQSDVPATVLFANVRVFDGTGAPVSEATNVLVRGNRIEKISSEPISTDRNADTAIVDGGGRVLMPGLIDAHWHSAFAANPLLMSLTGDFGRNTIRAGRQAEATLMRGFTSVRDMGGPSLGIKQSIDDGTIPGPRIWPSGAMISQTGGHGDFRLPTEIPRSPNGPLSYAEQVRAVAIADGVDQVLLRSREQLMLGATQLKLMAGGGVASSYDPLDVSQYTEAEFQAAVSAAENWGTYVTVHAYTPRAVQTAISAGVKCIEHGQLVDEATVKLMAEKGVWWSLQPFLDDEDANSYPEGSSNRVKQIEVSTGTDNAYRLAKQYKVNLAWGTDVLFNPAGVNRQGARLAKMVRWFTPSEILAMATSSNARLLELSGLRSTYQGKLGVIEEGALADLLLINGNPVEDINLITDPEQNLLVIMKDGKFYKNIVAR